MATVDKREIPCCPLMSAGSDVDMICRQERCGWYLPTVKKCSVYMLGLNALLEANLKQIPKNRV